jgi:hypothetical protein
MNYHSNPPLSSGHSYQMSTLIRPAVAPLSSGHSYQRSTLRPDFICTVLPRSIAPRFIANLAYHQNSHLSWFPPLKIPRYTAKLSYRHPPRVFRQKSYKTNLNSPVSTTHKYLSTAVYWSVIMECQDWSLDTVIDLIVEGRNRWVVLIRIITCIYRYFSSDYF